MFQADERLTSLSAITVSRYCDFVWFPPRIRDLDPTRTFGGEVSPKRGVGHRETQLSTSGVIFHLEVLPQYWMMMILIMVMMMMVLKLIQLGTN